MARTNDGHIMSNGYQRGGAQLKKSSTLDIIEQLSRIGSNMAAGARARRERKSNTLQRAIGRIVGQDGVNYKKLYLPDTDDQLLRIKSDLMQYGNKINNADLETRELYKFILDDIDNHQVQNEDYRAKKTMLEGYYNDMQKSIDDYYKSQSTVGSEGNKQAYDNMKKLSENYINIYNEMFSIHGDRVKNDMGVVSTFKAMDTASRFAMEQYISGDFRTDPREYEALKTALMIKDTAPIETYRQEFASSQDMKRRSLYQDFERNNDTIATLEDSLSKIFSFNDAILNPEDFLGSDKDMANLESYLQKKVKDGSLENELGDQLRIYMEDENLTWKGVAEGQLSDMYSQLWQENVYVKQMKTLQERNAQINASYADVNMGESLVSEELFPVGGEEKIMPSVSLVDEINKHIASQKQSTMFNIYKTNDLYELQTVIREAYRGSKNEGEQANMQSAWKALLNTINRQLAGSPEANAGGFANYESFYDGQIKESLAENNEQK